MHNHNFVLAGEFHSFRVKVQSGNRAGRVIRVVQPHHLCFAGYLFWDGIQVRKKVIFF